MKNTTTDVYSFLQGGGEMGELIRMHDWAQTTLGTPDGWPQSLRTTLSIILNSKFPMFLLWGAELLSFYNDAYRPTLGTDGKHPYALGKPGKDVWPEAWLAVKPMIDQVLSGGEALWLEDQLIPVYRNGRTEDVYWTFSYSPVHDESGLPAGVFIMCTETTKTFKSFQESTDQLQFAIEAAELATWDINPIRNTFTANDRYTEWFGIPAANETDNSLALNVIADEDRARVIAAYSNALIYGSGNKYDIEYTIRPKGKPERILRAKGKVWFNQDKIAYRFNGTLQDVTREANAKRDLAVKKQSLELAIEIGELGIFAIDLQTNNAVYSQKIMEWFGFTEQDLPLPYIFSKIHPEDQAFVTDTIDRSIAKEWNGRHDIMYRIINPNDGKLRYLRSIGQVQFQENAPVHISGIIQDVTAQVQANHFLKESEERFRILADAAPNFVWMLNPDGSYKYVNKETLDYLGVSQVEMEALGWGPFIHPDELVPISQAVAKAVQSKKPYNEEHHLRRHDGEYRWVLSKAVPSFGADGALYGYVGSSIDIHDLKLAAKKIQESEAKLQSIIAAAPAAIGLFVGRDLIIEMPNQTFIDIVGKGPDIEGKPLREVMPELITENQPFLQILDNVYTSGKMFQSFGAQVQIVQHGVMTYNYYNITYTPLFDAEEKVYAILDIAVDVTEQVQARKRLEESEQQVRSLVESAPFPIGVFIGREMRIQLANQAIMDAWGKGHDIIGKLYSEVLPELDNQEIFSQLDGVYTTGIPFHAKNQRVDLLMDGKLHPYYFNYSFTPLFDSDGNVYGVMNTGADVTDLNIAKQKLQQSEQNLRSMILQAPVAICIFKGPTHVVEIANERMFELWGRQKEEVLHKSIFEGMPEVKDQGYEGLLSKVFTTGETFSAQGIPVTLPRNGSVETVYVNLLYEAFREGDGTISGIMAVAIEVTEQVLARRKIEEVVAQRTEELAQANDTLIKTNQELSRSNANLEEFAYAASHDLKEPIRKIHFFADRLRNSLGSRLTEEEGRVFDRMEVAAKRMSSLIDDLLTYSQISLRPRSFEVVNMNQLIDLVMSDLDLEIEEKGAAIRVDKLFTINGHHRQLQQAFQNLIGNALKYSKPDSRPEIRITCSQVLGKDSGLRLSPDEQGQKYYVVQVADNGIGFEQKDAERIFNVFTRLHGNAEFRGTGIGLSIVRKVFENHGGYITAESHPGEGAVFKVYLPAM